MNTSEFSLVPLQKASLCLDCDMITATHTHCLACGSAALMYLARTLNGGGCADSMPRGLAPIATASVRHPRETPAFSGAASIHRRPHAGKCVTFPSSCGRGAAGAARVGPGGWRDSLRQMASVVQRTIATAVFVAWLSWCSHAGPR
jgi:hypothetical protein